MSAIKDTGQKISHQLIVILLINTLRRLIVPGSQAISVDPMIHAQVKRKAQRHFRV